MSLSEKVDKALEITNGALLGHPIVMSSFGKDSMVLLDLVERCGVKPRILFHRQPQFGGKRFIFADSIISERDYTVYDYLPTLRGFSHKANEVVLYMPLGMINGKLRFNHLGYNTKTPSEGEDFLCGYQDVYLAPVGFSTFPWDTILIGHKSCDNDSLMGRIPLKDFVSDQDGLKFVYPLKDFTDEDIWEYTLDRNLPINYRRYDRNAGFKEFQDKTYNNDYITACFLCMHKSVDEDVECPKGLVNRGQKEYLLPVLWDKGSFEMLEKS